VSWDQKELLSNHNDRHTLLSGEATYFIHGILYDSFLHVLICNFMVHGVEINQNLFLNVSNGKTL